MASFGIKIKNIKITLIAFLSLLVISLALFSFAQENSNSSQNIFQDSDQDGLGDSEEKVYGTNPLKSDSDGDGYSDGTEVKSGYDPLKPAPGDKLGETNAEKREVAGTETTTSSKNLTAELSDQVSTLINNKAEKNETISIDDLDSIISNSTASTLGFEDLPEIDKSTIKIKEQDYSKLSEDEQKAREKEDAQEYLTAVSYIMLQNSPVEIKNIGDLNNFANSFASQITNFSESYSNISYFQKLAANGTAILDQLNDIEVPEDFLDLHVQGLKLATYSISLKDKYGDIDANDPVTAIVSLSEAQSLLTLTEQFANDFQVKLVDLGIETSLTQ